MYACGLRRLVVIAVIMDERAAVTTYDPITIYLEHQHVVALRKALALAVLCDMEKPEGERKLTWADRKWIAEAERQLWPGWRPAHERRYPNP